MLRNSRDYGSHSFTQKKVTKKELVRLAGFNLQEKLLKNKNKSISWQNGLRISKIILHFSTELYQKELLEWIEISLKKDGFLLQNQIQNLPVRLELFGALSIFVLLKNKIKISKCFKQITIIFWSFIDVLLCLLII